MIAPAQRRSPFSDLWDNPIIHREGVPRRLRQMNRGRLLALLLVTGAIEVVAALYLIGLLGETAPLIAFLATGTWAGLVVLLGGLHGARTVAQERTAGTWDQIIVSALSRRQIVVGKLLGTLIPLWLPGLVLLPFFSVLSVVTPGLVDGLWGMTITYASALLGGACAASVGLWWSVRAQSVFSAQLATVLSGWAIMTFAPGAALLPALFLPDWTGGVISGLAILLPGTAALVHLLTRFDAIERARRA
jgi:ABC-type transport system involved in multi-copper enzyme maturation permease subunit